MPVKIPCEVIYAADAHHYKLVALQVAEHTSIESVIQQSGILADFPEIDLIIQKVGIFGRLCALSETISAGDRVEIYRPLQIQPQMARRLRAKHRGS